MSYKAKVICDSIAPSNVRLTTMLVRYPNIIKQDLWTHRSISKNPPINLDCSRSSNSNRAIPTKRIIADVYKYPFVPERFPKRASTMHSSNGYLTGWRHHVARHAWLKLRYIMILAALMLQWLGVHKQIANRLLDQWQWTTAVFTGVDEWWGHFFSLRAHYAAQDEVQAIATHAQDAYRDSTPTPLDVGMWHMPFVTANEYTDLGTVQLLKLSVARCARISYVDINWNELQIHEPSDEYKLHDRLAVQTPEHAGPREHQASAMPHREYRSGNLYGWCQLRHSSVGDVMRERELARLPQPLTHSTQHQPLAPNV